ncbi:hypothetical protein FF096_04135 [Micromonospora sp. CP22]|nr:hypothetical protein [Micromonospora sp. CP22]
MPLTLPLCAAGVQDFPFSPPDGVSYVHCRRATVLRQLWPRHHWTTGRPSQRLTLGRAPSYALGVSKGPFLTPQPMWG